MPKILQRVQEFAALLVLILTVLITVVPGTVSAAPANPLYCDADAPLLTNSNFGTEVPVILVHGMGNMNSNAAAWGSLSTPSSFAGSIDRIPGVAVAHLFHYDTSVWVDQDSGPKLAKTIDCVSRLSAQNGGKGKVIIVGYSMGGLVARDALSRYSTDGQRAIANEVGQVITIGSPHRGANVWTWSVFNPGSPELAGLPHFPAQTTVRTIAGDVTKAIHDLWNGQVVREQTYSDTIVATNSAHSEYSIDVDKGGGQKTISCDKYYIRVLFATYDTGSASCQHDQLISHPLNGVRADTIDAIKKQVAWLNRPTPPAVSLTIGNLTTAYDDRWTNVKYGASGPGEDGSGTDMTNGVPCTNCGDVTPTPTSYAAVHIMKMNWCTDRTLLDCTTHGTTIGPAPAVTVGGRTPDSSARYEESGGYTGTALAWCFEQDKICITYRRAANSPQIEPSAALMDLFNAAAWANAPTDLAS